MKKTYGNRVRRASVMPNPARRMGVNPTRGLTTEPVKALIGDSCGLIVREGTGDSPVCRIGDFSSYPLYGYLL